MRADVERFLERFARFGAAPSAATYLPLFHPDATLFDSGMERPITVPEIPDHIGGILAIVPDFEMTPERFRFRSGTLFVEARNRATLGGSAISWRSVYCVDLAGARVIRGRRYYDRQPLLARVAPGVPGLAPIEPAASAEPPPAAAPVAGPEAFVAACAESWRRGRPAELQRLYREDGCLTAPGAARPLARSEVPAYYAELARQLPDLELEPVAWAGDEALVFIEWQASATLGGRTLRFGSADRYDLGAGQVLAGRSYFDTAALAAAAR